MHKAFARARTQPRARNATPHNSHALRAAYHCQIVKSRIR